MLLASAACGGLAHLTHGAVAERAGKAAGLIAAIACGVVVYVLVARLLGVSNQVRSRLRIPGRE